jgi:DNA-binding beta-propeller fold protein YncE
MTVAGWGVVPTAQQKETKGKKPVPAVKPAQLVWPLPPEQPRIRYVTTYRGETDFTPPKKPARWKKLLLGEDPAQTPTAALVKPYGIAVAPTGEVYVTDTAAGRVFAFNAAAKTVTFVGAGGTGRVTKPIGVAVDADGTVFVADSALNRIFGYRPDGNLALAIGREGELENPSGLAVDRVNSLLYVADSKKHQVMCYSSTDGSQVRVIGERGEEPGKFNFPTNLSVDQQGRLYVADTLNFRVQVFDKDGSFLKVIGGIGDRPGRMNRPKGVGVDSEGHIYVADASFNNFQLFDFDGNVLLFVGTAGREFGEFLLPAGLFVDHQDRIYVADQGNARVQVFQYLKSPVK